MRVSGRVDLGGAGWISGAAGKPGQGGCAHTHSAVPQPSLSPFSLRLSIKDLPYNMALNVRQPEIAAGVAEGQARVVQAEQVQQRRVHIVHVDLARNRLMAELVGLAVSDAGTHTTARKPHREAARVVVAAGAVTL